MGEITIWHWVVVAAVIGLYFLFRPPKRYADGSAVSSVPRNARKSLLFGEVTLVSDTAGARDQIDTLIQEAKAKAQEYEWQYKDSGNTDASKNHLRLISNEFARLLELKKSNIGLTDHQLLLKDREIQIEQIFKNKSLQEIDNFSATGFKYLATHPTTKFFSSFLLDDDELRKFKQDAKAALSSSLIRSARDTVANARKAIPSDPNIALVEKGLHELGQGKDFSAFNQQAALSNLKSGLRSAELKALSANRATVYVASKASMHHQETKFRNAQEAFQNVQKGLFIPAGSQITCHVTDVYGNNTLVFSASTDFHNDISKPLFHTDWRPQ